jgi:hypothetical protein
VRLWLNATFPVLISSPDMQQPIVQEKAQVIEEVLHRIEELERLLREERVRFQKLVSGLLALLKEPPSSSDQDVPEGAQEIRATPKSTNVIDHESPKENRLTRQGKVDGRSRFDPEKYMKISVVRTLEWAKRHGKGAVSARGRVIEKAQERAMHYGFDAVPESVQAYIQSAVRQYE